MFWKLPKAIVIIRDESGKWARFRKHFIGPGKRLQLLSKYNEKSLTLSWE